MNFISFLLLLTSVFSAQAANAWNAQIYLLNPEIRLERSADQEIVQRKPLSLSFSYRNKMISGLFESSSFSEESGNNTLKIERSMQSYLVWARVHFFSREQKTYDLSLYTGAAAGTYQESVMTTLNSFRTKDKGSQNLGAGLAAGVDSAFRIYKSLAAASALEARLLFGQDYDPNPNVSLICRFGIQF